MSFNVQPIREFVVRPALPRQLSRMSELAYNILWSWEPAIRALFRRLDPALWKESGYNPVVMLGRVSQTALERAANDPRYMALYQLACQRFDVHMTAGTAAPAPGGKLIAYFSAEYGLTECMPVYSGGLGVLSGDHMKSASDLNLPLVGVALLYQLGYFRQFLNADGWQQERYLENDFYSLPIRPAHGARGQARGGLCGPAGRSGRHPHLDHGHRTCQTSVPRYEYAPEPARRRPCHRQPALWRRQRYAHSPGDRPRH